MTSPRWTRATIIGCGLIGGSFALALKDSGTCRSIAGWDTSEELLNEALQRSIINEIDRSFDEGAVSQSDLIYLAIPVGGILDFLRMRGKQINAGALVTDAGSTKLEICRMAREHLPTDKVFIGGHPIAGSEHSGLDHADAAIFTDAPYVLVSDGGETVQGRSFEETLQAFGAQVMFMTAREHDRFLAFVSHLPQLLSSTLAATLVSESDADSLLDLSGRGLRDMTRLAVSSWPMWHDILETNHAQIGNALDLFVRKLEMVRSELRSVSERERNEMIETEQIFTVANHLAKARWSD